MENELRTLLLTTAELYAQAAGCAVSTASRRCRGEPGFFKRIAKPENSFTARTFDEVMAWFADNWPEEKDLPAHLRRFIGKSQPREAASRAEAGEQAVSA